MIQIKDSSLNRLVFVDTESMGPDPGTGFLTEIGAVHYATRQTFYWRIFETVGYPPIITNPRAIDSYAVVFTNFANWLEQVVSPPARPIFITDNLAFDWQWINYHFHTELGRNPFGYSGRRINDLYAGLTGDFDNQSAWKSLRVTPHTHNPVEDAMGNVEAFSRILKGETGR